MLYNELHQGGIRALADYDDTIFDNLVLPEDINTDDVKQMVIDDILFRYGDTPLFCPEPTVMKYYIGVWSTRMLPLWERFYNVLIAEYNPIENYNRIEYRTEDTYNEIGNTRTLDTSNVVDGEVNESGTDTTENSVSAENVSTFEADNKSVRTPDLKTENDVTTTDSGTISDDGVVDGLVTIDSTIHGNIGVMSSQNMVNQELDLIHRLDLIKYISDCFHTEFCLFVY